MLFYVKKQIQTFFVRICLISHANLQIMQPYIIQLCCDFSKNLYVLATRFLIQIFMDNPSEPALISGIRFLNIVAPFYFVVSAKLAADGILRGAGLMKQFMIATFTDLTLRVVLAIVLSGQWGYVGIWCAWPVCWCIATVLSIWFYRNGPWKSHS